MSQTRERVTEKRTVSEASSGSHGDFDLNPSVDIHSGITFKPSFTPRRSNVIQLKSIDPGFRQSMVGSSSRGDISYVQTVEYGHGSKMDFGLGPGGYERVSTTGANAVKNSREREKKDTQELDEKFSNYIEKVRLAQKRKLASELEMPTGERSQETSIVKQIYEMELSEARRLIDDLTREKTNLEIKNQALQEQMQDMQRQYV